MIACRFVRVLLACCAGLSTHSAHATQDAPTLARVVELAGHGAYTDALSIADSLAAPLARAQGRLYVFHHAGDLGAALNAGLDGLRDAPADLWLLERVGYIAISLRATRIARDSLDRFTRAVDALPPSTSSAESSRWKSVAADERAQVADLERAALARSHALFRARCVVAVTVVGFWIWLVGALRRRWARGAPARVPSEHR